MTSNYHYALKITSDEAAKIAYAMRTGDFRDLRARGIVIQGVKYQFLRGENDWEGHGKVAIGMKKGFGGVILRSSMRAVVIGHVPVGRVMSVADRGLKNTVMYLASVGY